LRSEATQIVWSTALTTVIVRAAVGTPGSVFLLGDLLGGAGIDGLADALAGGGAVDGTASACR
jgi:hypothetical protein